MGMAYDKGYRSSAAERRAKIAEATARQEAKSREEAAMTLDAFVALKLTEAPPAAHCQEQTRVWAIARHAELVAQFS
jgi:hypothetical protein